MDNTNRIAGSKHEIDEYNKNDYQRAVADFNHKFQAKDAKIKYQDFVIFKVMKNYREHEFIEFMMTYADDALVRGRSEGFLDCLNSDTSIQPARG
jgi:major membrane immunogen (membrane-anchored lipoprotein)